MRSSVFILVGFVFASCGGETTGVFGSASSGSSGSSSTSSSSGDVSSSSSSSSGAGGAPSSSSSSSSSSSGDMASSSGGGAGGSASSSSSSSSSSSGCSLQCPPYQECKPDGTACWGCVKSVFGYCLLNASKTQEVVCEVGYSPPDCDPVANKPNEYCCVPK